MKIEKIGRLNMKSIKYQLLGIGILLFAASPYIIGIMTNTTTYFFAGLFLQIIGILVVVLGFIQER